MVALIPLLPFAGFLLNAFFGRRLSKSVSGAAASAVMAASFVVSIIVVWQMLGYPPESREISSHIFNWITSGDLSVDVTLRVDPLSAVMILIITGIGTLIHVYSTAYMHDETDGEFARYFSYLNLFAAFMLVLVLASNFVVMFLGWEGVGLCSYLLVGFWYQKKSAGDAGKKAFIVNRVGDFGFLLGVFLIFVHFGTLDFQHIARAASALGPETTFGAISTMTLLLFVGATGKSAQIPLFVWLPDAMEGPTPVSALIHAATMVTAGVYMIGRNAVLFSLAPQTLTIIAVIGTATALMAGTIALVQNDIKKVLAYSTVSQLGYMFMAMGVGAYASGIFHLYTHAFFKALLFLGSGAVIHALHGEQDMRRMGGLKKELPLTYWTFLAGAIAIAGVPGFAGFFSKDEILYNTFASGHLLLWAVGLLTSLLTAVYMFRVVFLTFHGQRRPLHQSEGAPSPEHPEEEEPSAQAAHSSTPVKPSHPLNHGNTANHENHLHDAPPAMALALVVLAIGSVVAGYAGLGGRFAHFLEPSFGGALVDRGGEGSTESTLMVVSSLMAVTGIGLAFFFFLKSRDAARSLAASFSGVHRVLARKYYVDDIYDAGIVQPIRIIAEDGLWKGLDVRVIDGAVNGAAEIVGGTSSVLRRLQTGSVRAYAVSLFVGVVAILGYYLWR